LAPKAKPLKPIGSIDRKPTGKADRDSAVKKFLIDRVPKWDEDLQLSALGLDSLDTVQLRNAFNATFHVRLPLGLFAAPNQTLRQLYSKLIDSVPQS
jgi:acyl carrier protein